MGTNPDILKAGAIILDQAKRLLIVKPRDNPHWLFVGGKIEAGETPLECLQRELREELDVELVGEPRLYLESPVEPAAGNPERTVQVLAYLVDIHGHPKPSQEIETLRWLSAQEFSDHNLLIGSILREHTIPRLIRDGLMA